MTDFILLAVIALIVGGAALYIYKKKSGAKCVGCPYAKQCGGACSGGCGHAETDRNNDKK